MAKPTSAIPISINAAGVLHSCIGPVAARQVEPTNKTTKEPSPPIKLTVNNSSMIDARPPRLPEKREAQESALTQPSRAIVQESRPDDPAASTLRSTRLTATELS